MPVNLDVRNLLPNGFIAHFRFAGAFACIVCREPSSPASMTRASKVAGHSLDGFVFRKPMSDLLKAAQVELAAAQDGKPTGGHAPDGNGGD